MKEVRVERNVNADNDAIAAEISKMLKNKGILSVNVMGAPGSGKTTLIEGLGRYLDNMLVIQGDLESDIDKRRLESVGIPAVQVNTHSGCHLNAKHVRDALAKAELSGIRYLLIENVGNLVCPAGRMIGQHVNIVLSATTEGSDKPEKYPVIFHHADMVLITKHDLSEAVGFDEAEYLERIGKQDENLKIFSTSTDKPESFKAVAEQLELMRETIA